MGTYHTTSTSATGDFTFTDGTAVTTPDYEAWYPTSIYNAGTPTLPATQTYAAGNIAEAPMYATGSTTDLKFKNLCGIVRLELSTSLSDQKVRRIVVSANEPMSGPFTITSDAAVISSGTAGVTLDCGSEGVAIGSSPTSFYIAVPENNYTGLAITLWTTGGLTQTLTLKSDKTVVVSRSSITPVTLSFNNLAVQPVDIAEEGAALTIPAETYATLTGTNTSCVVTIEDGAVVALSDAAIAHIEVPAGAEATLVLDGANTLNNGNYRINLAANSLLTIRGDGSLFSSDRVQGVNGSNADLVIESGTVTLLAQGIDQGTSYGGITVRNLTVNGGSLTTQGGANWYYGYDDSKNGIYAYGNIVITGGEVNTNGAYGMRAQGDITISGGTVVAKGRGERYTRNAGISAAGTLTISGGSVTATSNDTSNDSPGIGDRNSCGDIVITGGEVTAIGGSNGAGIGTGATGTCGSIRIEGGTVTATGGSGAAAIGTGNGSAAKCGDITILSTVTLVTVTPGTGATAAIGQGHESSTVGTVTIETGANVA